MRLRLGMVLSPAGGGLKKMLLPFRLGAGGRIGSGRQYLSWIALDDAVGAIHHALTNGSLAGPVNAVAPSPVTNAEFTRALARVLRRPAVAPMPRSICTARSASYAPTTANWTCSGLTASAENRRTGTPRTCLR